jgi:hypothetical protein
MDDDKVPTIDDFELEETILPFETEVDEYVDDEEDHSSDELLEEE